MVRQIGTSRTEETGQYRDFPLKEICFSALSTFSTTGFGSWA